MGIAPRHTLWGRHLSLAVTLSVSRLRTAEPHTCHLLVTSSALSRTSQLLSLRFGASTSLSPALTLPTSALRSFTLLWWRPHESKINTNCLIQELGVVGAFDRGFGFFLRGVFDKNVALSEKRCQLSTFDQPKSSILSLSLGYRILSYIKLYS